MIEARGPTSRMRDGIDTAPMMRSVAATPQEQKLLSAQGFFPVSTRIHLPAQLTSPKPNQELV
jgi:hypothetical protein